MKLQDIDNNSSINSMENASAIKRLKKYKSQRELAKEIGLIFHLSNFYGIWGANDDLHSLSYEETSLDSSGHVRIYVEGVVKLKEAPTNTGGLTFHGYGRIELHDGTVVYEGRAIGNMNSGSTSPGTSTAIKVGSGLYLDNNGNAAVNDVYINSLISSGSLYGSDGTLTEDRVLSSDTEYNQSLTLGDDSDGNRLNNFNVSAKEHWLVAGDWSTNYTTYLNLRRGGAQIYSSDDTTYDNWSDFSVSHQGISIDTEDPSITVPAGVILPTFSMTKGVIELSRGEGSLHEHAGWRQDDRIGFRMDDAGFKLFNYLGKGLVYEAPSDYSAIDWATDNNSIVPLGVIKANNKDVDSFLTFTTDGTISSNSNKTYYDCFFATEQTITIEDEALLEGQMLSLDQVGDGAINIVAGAGLTLQFNLTQTNKSNGKGDVIGILRKPGNILKLV